MMQEILRLKTVFLLTNWFHSYFCIGKISLNTHEKQTSLGKNNLCSSVKKNLSLYQIVHHNCQKQILGLFSLV